MHRREYDEVREHKTMLYRSSDLTRDRCSTKSEGDPCGPWLLPVSSLSKETFISRREYVAKNIKW